MLFRLSNKNKYTDVAIVEGIQLHKKDVEEWMYKHFRSYFMSHFNDIFFDEDRRQEIFHDSIIRLWTDIENGKITVEKGKLVRQQKDGTYGYMTCSLTTFLMAIAKNEYREIVRNIKELSIPEYFEDAMSGEANIPVEEDEDAVRARVVDECMKEISPRCIEILTLFYYEGKSLDEIMLYRQDKNLSKDGLKSAKHKCMVSLRKKVVEEFDRQRITI